MAIGVLMGDPPKVNPYKRNITNAHLLTGRDIVITAEKLHE